MTRRKLLLALFAALSVVVVGSAVFIGIVDRRFGRFARPDLGKLAGEARPLLVRIEEYKRRHGKYAEGLDEMLGDGEARFKRPDGHFSWSGWEYFGGDEGFGIYKYTGHLRDTLWYGNESSLSYKYRWYLDDESGDPVKLVEVREWNK